jgi:hypothetical protein
MQVTCLGWGSQLESQVTHSAAPGCSNLLFDSYAQLKTIFNGGPINFLGNLTPIIHAEDFSTSGKR